MMQQDKLVNQHRHRNKMTFAFTCALLIAACFSTTVIMADSSNATMQISATVASKCLMQGETLNFGTYDPASANDQAALNATGNLQVKCTRNTSATITMDGGQYPAQASGTSRAMRSADGNSYLSYDLYLDPARSTVWNNTNKVTYSAATAAASQSFSIYGSVPASQDVGDGQYNDVVTITANF